MTDLVMRNNVQALARALDATPGVIHTQTEENGNPVRHHFANGVYCREAFLPAGCIVVSKIHRYPTNNILAMGKVAVANPEQEGDIYTAPHVWTSPGGSQRAVTALEDTIWVTTHPVDLDWDENDLDKIEAIVIAESFEQLEAERAALECKP